MRVGGEDDRDGGPPRRRTQRVLFAAALAVLVLGTVIGSLAARSEAYQSAERRNVIGARQASAALERSIDGLVSRLGGSATIVDAQGVLRTELFDAFVDDTMQIGGLWGVVLLELVRDAERPAWEASRGLEITTASPSGLVPSPSKERYYPVLGVRPDLAGRSISGFDFGSDPVHRDALEDALTSRDTAVGGAVVLAGDGTVGIPLARPLLDPRTGDVRGFVVAGEPFETLLRTVRDAAGQSMRVAVLREGDVLVGDEEVAADPAAVREAQVTDERWEVAVAPVAGPDLLLAQLVGLGGGAATLAMLALLLVTERHQRALRSHAGRLQVSERRSRALQQLTGQLAHALTAEEVRATLLEHLPPSVEAAGVTLIVADAGDDAVFFAAAGSEGVRRSLPGESRVRRALETGEAAWLGSPRSWLDDPETGAVAGGAGSLALVPFRADDVRGVVAVTYDGHRSLDADEQSVLQTAALLSGRALARGRRYDAEHQAAIEFQRAALPSSLPEVRSLDIAACYQPAAREAAVGGDWYDTFVIDEHRTMLIVGDVVGHSMAAAATMGRLRTAFHVMASTHPSPARLLEAVNAQVDEIPEAFCTTVVCAVVDTQDQTLTWSRAGHLPPLVLDRTGTHLLDDRPMPPLGVAPGISAPEHVRAFGPGDLVLLYTDGVVERRDEGIGDGLERLVSTASALGDLEPGEFCDALLEALGTGDLRRDDVAALAVRAQPERARATVAPTSEGTLGADRGSALLSETQTPGS